MGYFMKQIKLNLPLAVFTNTFYQGIAQVIATGFGLLTTIFLTRYLGVLGFGQLNVIFAYLAVASTFADLGLGMLLTREYSLKNRRKDYINNIFSLRIITSLIVLLFFLFISIFLPYSQIVKVGIAIYTLGQFFLLLYNLQFAIFRAELRFEKHLLALTTGSVLIFILTLVFINFNLPFLWFIAAHIVGNLAMFLVGLSFLKIKIKFSFSYHNFIEIARDAWPLALTGIIAVLYNRIDLLILSFFKKPDIFPDVGIYSTAYRVFEVLVIFGTFYANTLFPVFVKKKEGFEFKDLLRESLFTSAFLAILSVILVVILAKYIILVIAGGKFMTAVLPLQILSLAFALSLIVNIFYIIIVVKDQQKKIIPIGILALVFNIVANIIFIPKFSYLASSVITVMTNLIISTGYFLVVNKKL